VTHWEPEAVVVQVGIVDCAPRLFSPWQHAFLNNRWFHWRIARIIIRTASRYRRQIIAARPWVRYTSRRRFEKTLAALAGKVEGIPHLLVLPILETFPEHEYRSPGYNRSVRAYNRLWEGWAQQVGARFIRHEELVGVRDIRELLLTDGHHLSPAGHAAVAGVVGETLAERLA